MFLIDVLAEMLSSPLRLLSYIDRRVTYAARLNSINEHAIPGFHLSQNLWLEEEHSMAMIDDACATDLDAAMTVRREGVPGSTRVDLAGPVARRQREIVDPQETLMPLFWHAEVESARWIGPDLQFRARTEAGAFVYVIAKSKLCGVAQRTGKEALSTNFDRLKPIIVPLASEAQAGDTIAVG